MSDERVKAMDRGEFLKRAGTGAAVVGAAAAFPQGVWAGITKTSARKPLRIGNLLTLSGPTRRRRSTSSAGSRPT